ncbi:MAG: beta-glucosidase/6-phospho-beta-glucosidase/beta-galactosidase [Chloroflexi bacterium]|nr:beta-glucosidase/6-phospho-beta-glucosidase/beta-galactosidase [Chloroflexota bacterium]
MQIRAMTDLPIWWAEDYVISSDNWNFQAAAMASMLYHELRAGSAVSFRWQPQGDYHDPFRGNNQALLGDTREPGGGQPFPNYFVYRAINEYFPRGTPLVTTRVSSPDVEVLASPTNMLLINKRDAVVRAIVNRTEFMLAPYDVVVLPIPGAGQPGGARSAADG